MTDAGAWLVVAPLLIPLGTVLGVVACDRRSTAQRVVSLAGSVALLASALALVREVVARDVVRLAFGGWALPFAVEFRADRFAVAFVLLTALIALAADVCDGWRGDAADGIQPPSALTHGFVAGACGAFLTADLFNLYVWFEVVLVASLGMLAWGGRARHLDATFRYLVLNVVGTVFLLAGVACIYAVTGHLNFSAIMEAARALEPGRLSPFVAVLTTAFLIKAAAFPVFAWLPASYHTLPAPQAALFAGIGTKLGVYAILRIQMAVFGVHPDSHDLILGWIAAATMLSGVLGAAYHFDIRRILAFHSISQIGYMLLAIALGTPAGAQATLVFALHHGLVKSNLFLIASLIRQATGSYDLRRSGGLYLARPWLSLLFLSQALSLVGVPPLSGFWAKLLVIRETLRLGHTAWALLALTVGLLTLYSMLKIWVEAFWKAPPGADTAPKTDHRAPWTLAASVGLAALTLFVGLWPEPLLAFASAAARDLLGGEAR